jgi:hypothetical protein
LIIIIIKEMPTYRNGDQIKVVAPKEFTDRVKAAEAAAIIDSEIAKMKFNLSSRETKEIFHQWAQIKQETAQRLQRIDQHNQHHQEQQLRRESSRNQQLQRQRQLEKPTTESNNNTAATTNKEVVIRNLNMMKKLVSGS